MVVVVVVVAALAAAAAADGATADADTMCVVHLVENSVKTNCSYTATLV